MTLYAISEQYFFWISRNNVSRFSVTYDCFFYIKINTKVKFNSMCVDLKIVFWMNNNIEWTTKYYSCICNPTKAWQTIVRSATVYCPEEKGRR